MLCDYQFRVETDEDISLSYDFSSKVATGKNNNFQYQSVIFRYFIDLIF